MIGRRVAVLLQLPAQSRLLLANRSQSQHDLPLRTLFYQPRRLYATPGRPRKAVGEPSRPVKRAVKRSAAKATSPEESPAKQKVEAKKKSAAKKPAAKKAAAPKKQLTEEQRAAKAVKLDQAKIADLKKAALSPPKVTRSNAYLQFTAEKGKELKGLKSSSVADIRKTVGDHMKSSAAQWKQLSAAELEHYNHIAHTNREAAQAEYKRWVESHSPEAIQLANRARSQLKRKLNAKGTGKTTHAWSPIHDERAVKAPVSNFFQFSINRQASGDFKHIHVTERAKLISQEWKALSEGEKQKYKNLQEQDTKRYAEEYSSVYGHPPPSYIGGQQPQVPAGAAAAVA